MSFIIVPNVGVESPYGLIKFGMTREEVRAMVGGKSDEGPVQGKPCDTFHKLRFRVFYSAQSLCQQVDFLEDSDPILNDRHLLTEPYQQILSWFMEKMDPTVRGDNTGFESLKLGVALYIESARLDQYAECVHVFAPGSWERMN